MYEIDKSIDDIKFRNANVWGDENENVLCVDLYFPKQEQFNTVELDIVSSRANDTIRITYDFSRNGWLIKKSRIKQDIEYLYEYWEEVAFIADEK